MSEVTAPETHLSDFRSTVLNGLLQALSPPDTAALGVFGRTSIVVTKPIPLTKAAFESALRDVDALEAPVIARHRKALREPEFLPSPDSPIWDAGDHALRALATDARHRVVVMVTDGRATGNLTDPETLAERAVRSRTAMSFVHQGGAELVSQDAAGRAAVRSDVTLRWIAEATGGIYLADASARGLHPRFNVPAALVMQAINAHRESYVLGVGITASNRTRTLKVTTKDRALRVLAPASIPAGRL